MLRLCFDYISIILYQKRKQDIFVKTQKYPVFFFIGFLFHLNVVAV